MRCKQVEPVLWVGALPNLAGTVVSNQAPDDRQLVDSLRNVFAAAHQTSRPTQCISSSGAGSPGAEVPGAVVPWCWIPLVLPPPLVLGLRPLSVNLCRVWHDHAATSRQHAEYVVDREVEGESGQAEHAVT